MELKATSLGKHLAQHPYNRVTLLNAGVNVAGDKHEYLIPFNQLIAVNCKRGLVWGELEFVLPDNNVVRLHGTAWEETQRFYRHLSERWQTWSQSMSDVAARALDELVAMLNKAAPPDQWLRLEQVERLANVVRHALAALPLPHQRIPMFENCREAWQHCLGNCLMEKVAVAAARNAGDTVVCLTRYGNVMASRGSVIPLFLNQIKKQQPLTITDPNMTRFLMSLNDAVELVLFAFEHGNPGDLFVNKAPAATIGDLAQAIKELCNAQNEIKIIGVRHGEKLYETLCTREEMVKAEDMGDFYRVPSDNRDLNYARYFSEGQEKVTQMEDYHSHNTEQLNITQVKELISTLPLIRKEVFGEEVSEFIV